MDLLKQYQNGNVLVSLYEDGTRHLEYEGEMQLEQPLNIDITVTGRCSNGYDPRKGKAICEYCHVSARTDGRECEFDELKGKLSSLEEGVELAIAGNEISLYLMEFIEWCSPRFIVNLTVNQMHIARYDRRLRSLIDKGLVKGLGISYRRGYLREIPEYYIDHPNTVLHCIAGIDWVDEIVELPYKKILVLGYKSVGFGKDYYSPEVEKSIREWQLFVPKLFGNKVISFDNLAIEQLKIERFFTKEKWEVFYQGEESIYIDAVERFYSPSSREIDKKVSWFGLGIKDYYKQLKGVRV